MDPRHPAVARQCPFRTRGGRGGGGGVALSAPSSLSTQSIAEAAKPKSRRRHDPKAHAEVLAIALGACQKLNYFELRG